MSSSALLPSWVGWGRWVLLPISAFALTWLLARLQITWSRKMSRPKPSGAGELHWTERARLLWPLRRIPSTSALGVIALFVVVIGRNWLEQHGRTPVLLALVTLAAIGSAYRLEQRRLLDLFSPGEPREPLSRSLALLALRWGWIPLLAAVLDVPHESGDARWFALLGLVAGCSTLLVAGGWLRIAREVGLVRPARERMQAIVARLAAAAGKNVRAWELDLAGSRTLVQPGGIEWCLPSSLGDWLDDAQLETVLSRSVARMPTPRESRARWLRIPAWALGLLLGPVTHWISLALPVLVLVYQRLVESVAPPPAALPRDATGLRAIEILSEKFLSPVVVREPVGPPNLYDMLVAAGVQPAYPRPRPLAMHAPRRAVLPIVLLLLGMSFGHWLEKEERAPVLVSLAIYGPTPSALGALATLEYAGNPTRAADLYLAALELEPDSPWWRADLALTLAALGRCDEARDHLAEAERRAADDRAGPEDLAELLRSARSAVAGCQAR